MQIDSQRFDTEFTLYSIHKGAIGASDIQNTAHRQRIAPDAIHYSREVSEPGIYP
jgi:hypothetical protein